MAESSTESKSTGGPPSPGVRSPRVAGNSGKNTTEKTIGGSSTRSGAAAPIGENSSTSNAGESQPASLTSAVLVAGSASGNPLPGSVTAGAGQTGNSSPRSPKHPRRIRIKLTEQQLESATREELAAKWREQDLYVECLEAQAAAQEGELACLRDSEEKYRQQCCEVSHRERILVRRLASKEQQLLGYVNQITEMRAAATPSATALRSALLDPAVNILIQKLRQELQSTKAKLEDTQNELSAWKFTPDSNTGKRLMAKCRLLYQENEELGRMIASGRIAKLEGELALQKSFSEEVKKSQSELDEFLQDLDEDVEGMQSTIYFLQQELRKARESVSLLQQENNAFKSSTSSSSLPGPAPSQSADGGLSNGLSTLRPISIKKEEIVNETDHRVSDDTKFLPVKSQLDNETGEAPAQSSPSLPSGQLARNFTETKSELPERPTCRTDDNDESSNDSAALIIKVENEELSDRDDDDEDDEVEKSPIVSCENRGPQRQSARTKEKMGQTTKNESVIVGKSNGDEKSSSRSSSRRLVRDRTAKRDKSAADSDDDRRQHKKKRRESILSIDYNEDDALLLTNGEGIQSDTEDGP